MGDKVIALAGNPNVGKSTLFNALTGMKQHTGNWAGKTVSNATGRHKDYIFVDIPGTYSLMAHSAEEEVARDFICFGKPDAVVAVCDSTCIERNLNLVLQIIETGRKVIVDGKPVEMTPKEYDILLYMAKNINVVLSREKILEKIWGYEFFGDDRTVDTHIKMLRNSISPYRDYIKTVWGIGYKLEVDG